MWHAVVDTAANMKEVVLAAAAAASAAFVQRGAEGDTSLARRTGDTARVNRGTEGDNQDSPAVVQVSRTAKEAGERAGNTAYMATPSPT